VFAPKATRALLGISLCGVGPGKGDLAQGAERRRGGLTCTRTIGPSLSTLGPRPPSVLARVRDLPTGGCSVLQEGMVWLVAMLVPRTAPSAA
jgi:hypothetical protein